MRADHCGPESAEVLEAAQYYDKWSSTSGGCGTGTKVYHAGTVAKKIRCDICGYVGLDGPKPKAPFDSRSVLYSKT